MLTIGRELENRVVRQAVYRYPSLDETHITKILRENKVLFLFLVGQAKNPQEAFDTIYRAIQRGENPNTRFTSSSLLPDRRLREHFFGDIRLGQPVGQRAPPRKFPPWLVPEIRAYLRDQTPDDRKDFSVWLTAKLLASNDFMSHVELIRRRWRLDSKGMKPIDWFTRMNAAQEETLAEYSARGVIVEQHTSGTSYRLHGAVDSLNNRELVITDEDSVQVFTTARMLVKYDSRRQLISDLLRHTIPAPS